MPRKVECTVMLRPVLALLLLASTGCVTLGGSTYPVDAPSRPATNTPDRFMVGTIHEGGDLVEPQAGGGCRNPMVDPRDGTRLTLVQSQRGATDEIGDYSVPNARYGARDGELLRLNCGTGRALGFIPRRG